MDDAFFTCPHCGQRTRHRLFAERMLAPLWWCLGCFSTHSHAPDEQPAAAAEPPIKVAA